MKLRRLILHCIKQEGRNTAPERGFTLIETSIALVVITVVALGVLSLFTYSINYNSGGNDRAVAMSIAQQQVEALREVSFSDSSLNVTSSSGTTSTITSSGRTYDVTKTVTGSNNNTSGNPTLKTITITVKPRSSGWAGFPVVLVTQRCDISTGQYSQ